MRWEVIIPGEGSDSLSKSITVEAKNWFSALKRGLDEHGLDGKVMSNLSCDIQSDQSVVVRDFVTRRTYTLRPIDTNGGQASPPSEVPSVADIEEPVSPASGSLPPDLPEHQLFFSCDKMSEDQSGVYFCERLIAVPPEVDSTQASRLARVYFEYLKTLGKKDGCKLLVSIQVFDHEFEHQSKRPAIAALTWREWNAEPARIEFPLNGGSSVRLSALPMVAPESTGARASSMEPQADLDHEPLDLVPKTPTPVPAAPVPIGTTPSTDTGIPMVTDRESAPPARVSTPPASESIPPARVSTPPASESIPPARVSTPPEPEPTPVEPPAKAEVKPAPAKRKRRKKLSTPPPMMAPDSLGDPHIEDKMVQAFERMQEIYEAKTHDAAAGFALNLAQDLLDCEAGSCMVISPGKYELYVAAATGDHSEQLLGSKLSLNDGIVGFATRNGTVINVSDPANDSRFNSEVDASTGFTTRNIVCAPVQFEGRTIGALEMINSQRSDGFSQNDVNILSYVAGALAEYIDTSLPSRQADFTDKEFDEFTEAKKNQPKGIAGLRNAVKKKSKSAPKRSGSRDTSRDKSSTPSKKKSGKSSPAKSTKKKKKKGKKKK